MSDLEHSYPESEPVRKRPQVIVAGLPARPDAKRVGWVASLLSHLLALLLLLAPRLLSTGLADEVNEGAGGPGPAGGGGGGTRGTGGGRTEFRQERLQYIELAPAHAVEEVPEPEVPVPEPVLPPEPQVEIPPPQVTQLVQHVPMLSAPVVASTGVGGGTGSDGTSGTGPGSGGGVGSGIGTGRGSGVGPGTGGGDGEIHPPTPSHFFIPPLPAPSSVRGFQLVARFDVDEQGRARLLGFNPTPDRDYNRKLREALDRLRWRPGVRPDGTPVRQTATIHYSF